MNQKTSKVEKEFYLRCSYLTLSVLFDKEPKYLFTWKNDFEGTRLLCFFILQSRSFLERIAFAKQKIRWQLVK